MTGTGKNNDYITIATEQAQETLRADTLSGGYALHNKVTDGVALINTTRRGENPRAKRNNRHLAYGINGVCYTIKDFYKSSLKAGIGVHKLLLKASEGVLRNNFDLAEACRKKKLTAEQQADLENKVYTDADFSLRDFALMCGKKDFIPMLDTNGTSSLEEEKKASNNRKKFRRSVIEDLEVLENMMAKAKVEAYGQTNLFQHKFFQIADLIGDTVRIRFSQELAACLIQSPTIFIPAPMMNIPRTNEIAYQITYCLLRHYTIPSNIKKGVHNKLSVKSILEQTSLPAKDDKTIKHYGWQRRKEAFENNMELLKGRFGVLKSWEYDRPDEDCIPATNTEWEGYLVIYELTDEMLGKETHEIFTQKSQAKKMGKTQMEEKAVIPTT